VPRSIQVAVVLTACGLAVPAAAQAQTKPVGAGPPVRKLPAGAPKDATLNAFYPRTITVHRGDSLQFGIYGFHAVNFVKAGDPPPPFAVPAPGGLLTAGAKDAAGADFWFNGQPQLIFNPTLSSATKSGGAYDGSKAVSSGAPLAGPPKPWKVKLKKTGSFTFYCPIHPGMSGKVKVVGAGQPAGTARQDAARVAKQLAADVATVKRLARRAAPAGDVIQAGPDSKGGQTLLRFTPAKKTVKVGVPVTLTMTPGTRESHTFTFARDLKTLKPLTVGFISPRPGDGPPTLALASPAVYPSDAPPAPYDGTQHGDGFWNSGTLDGDPATPAPQSASITFSAPGTYRYLCIIHPQMVGEVVATS
jgi:plastocyanin